MENIFWEDLELVIFDVDGTLYRQSVVRKLMLFKLLKYYIRRPWLYKDLLILYHFRKEREKRAGYKGTNLKEEQYHWTAEKTNQPVEDVRMVVDIWIFEVANRYLSRALYPGVAQFFKDLKQNGIKIAIYSDYNSQPKLFEMGLTADLQVSSTDAGVNSFKPLPAGLLEVLAELKITNKNNCLFIGDRFELDGVCAKNAGIPFLLVEKDKASSNFYAELSNHLIQSRGK